MGPVDDSFSEVPLTTRSASSLTPARTPYQPKNLSFYIVITSLCICGFVSALDTIILASTLPSIAQSLHATTVAAYWCSSAFLFAQSVVQLVYATFAVVFDRRICMLIALVIFGSASVLCATAQNVQWLIAARTMQGVGTGGINTLIQLILTDIAPISERPKYTGIITLAAAIGLVSGSLCGAIIVQNTTWRLIFWINLPLCVLPFIGLVSCLRVPKNERQDLSPAVYMARQMDWGGLIIITGSLAGIIFALNSGNTVYPWASYKIIVPMACGCSGLILFGFYEEFVAKSNAILPRRLFSNLLAVSGYIITVIHAMFVWTVVYYFFLYLNICCNHSYLGASVLMLPTTLSFSTAAGVAGYILGRTSKHKVLNIVAFLLLLSGLAGFINLNEDSSTGLQAILLAITGIGGGIAFVTKVFMVQSAVAESDVIMATAIVATATSIGECFGVAVSGSVFQNTWQSLLEQHLEKELLSPVIGSQDAETSGAIIGILNMSTADVYRHIASLSFQRVWIVMTVLVGIAMLLILVSRSQRQK